MPAVERKAIWATQRAFGAVCAEIVSCCPLATVAGFTDTVTGRVPAAGFDDPPPGWEIRKVLMDVWVCPFNVQITLAVPDAAVVDEANGKTTKPSLRAVWGPPSKLTGVVPLLNFTVAVQIAPGVVWPYSVP